MGTRSKRAGGYGRALSAAAMAAAMTAVGGCSGHGGINTVDQCKDAANVELAVMFKGRCADKVELVKGDACDNRESDCFKVSRRAGMIRWASRDADGEPFDGRFALFFDPLMGRQYESSPQGCLRRSVNSNAPLGTYKYTIQTLTAQGKPDPECEVKDPKVIVSP
jgi:hypothetical protein